MISLKDSSSPTSWLPVLDTPHIWPPLIISPYLCSLYSSLTWYDHTMPQTRYYHHILQIWPPVLDLYHASMIWVNPWFSTSTLSWTLCSTNWTSFKKYYSWCRCLIHTSEISCCACIIPVDIIWTWSTSDCSDVLSSQFLCCSCSRCFVVFCACCGCWGCCGWWGVEVN